MSSSNGGGRTAPAAVERKEIERKRRQEMRRLCVKLASLLPKEQHSSRLGSLDEAAAYIKKLKERVEALQQKKSSLQLVAAMRGGAAGVSTSAATTTSGDAGSDYAADDDDEAVAEPVVEVRQHNDDGSSMEVVLTSSIARPFKLHEVVTVLEEEGAEIINANFSVTGQQIFHTIHCVAFCLRIGIDVARVSERLRALI